MTVRDRPAGGRGVGPRPGAAAADPRRSRRARRRHRRAGHRGRRRDADLLGLSGDGRDPRRHRLERCAAPATTRSRSACSWRRRGARTGSAPRDGASSPPPGSSRRGRAPVPGSPIPITLRPGEPRLPCPRCGSADTEETSRFGATACKSLHRCRELRRAVRALQGAVTGSAFHSLAVADVAELCDDAVAITFDVPAELGDAFAFRPGQWVTVRRFVDGVEQRRSYSICAPAGAPPRIGVREVPDGAVSTWLVRDVRPGDRIEVQPPSGTFTPDIDVVAHHVLIVAGSGITPALSIAGSVLANPASRVTVLYGNRRTDTVMFADELADLKDREPVEGRARPRVVARAAPAGVVQRPARRRQAPAAPARRWSPSPTSTTGGCAVRTEWSSTPSRCSASSVCPAIGSTASCSTSRTPPRRRPSTSSREATPRPAT